MNYFKRLILGLIVLMVIALSFILYLSLPLISGERIVLDTRPVDPFDIFRGQYLTINYEISNLELIEGVSEGDFVYVLLKEDINGIFRPEKTLINKPSEGIFIRGNVKSTEGNRMRLEYGIEQYFFERNAILPIRNITVEAKVDSTGRARIVNLLQNKKPIVIKYEKVSTTS